jgi:hypothetical protein
MTDQGLLSATAVLLASVLFWWGIVARLTKIWALIRLHYLRDDLFRLAVDNPWLLDTPTYRYVEFLATGSIHIVRDQPYWDLLEVWRRIVVFSTVSVETKTAICSDLHQELESYSSDPSKVTVIEKVLTVAARVRWPFTVASLGGNPAVFGLAAVLYPAYLLLSLAGRWLSRAEIVLCDTVGRIAAAMTDQGVKIYRRTSPFPPSIRADR